MIKIVKPKILVCSNTPFLSKSNIKQKLHKNGFTVDGFKTNVSS